MPEHSLIPKFSYNSSRKTPVPIETRITTFTTFLMCILTDLRHYTSYINNSNVFVVIFIYGFTVRHECRLKQFNDPNNNPVTSLKKSYRDVTWSCVALKYSKFYQHKIYVTNYSPENYVNFFSKTGILGRNVTLRRVRATTVPWKSNKYYIDLF